MIHASLPCLVKEDNCQGQNIEQGVKREASQPRSYCENEVVRSKARVLVFLNCSNIFINHEMLVV